jgi:hypothetical protein
MTDEQKAELEACESDEARNALLARVATSNDMVFNNHAVPVTPGQSRLFFRIEAPGMQGTPMARIIQKRPVWLDHLLRNEILDGDLVFLHRQSQHMTQGVRFPTPVACCQHCYCLVCKAPQKIASLIQ